MENQFVEYYPNFYNDVYGPIMQAGSSSHTAGPCRIGYMANSCLGEKVAGIKVILDQDGSYAGTFGVMREDLGMLSGAYGLLPDDIRLFSIKEILREAGIPFEFVFSKITESDHINAVKFILTGQSGKKISLVGNSVGGGMVELVNVNGFPCRGIGDSFVFLAEDPHSMVKRDACQFTAALDGFISYHVFSSENGVLHCVYTSEDKDLSALPAFFEGLETHMILPVLPVITSKKRGKQLFSTFTEWKQLSRESGKSLAEVAVSYQMAASNWKREDVVSYMYYIAKMMHRQTHRIFDADVRILDTPFSGFHALQWGKYLDNHQPILGDTVSAAIKYAYAAITAAYGVEIVPGPMGTGGGILYAVLSAAQEVFGYSEEQIVGALFIAAGIGVIAYTRTNPTGEIIGCAGECGICSAMAAAGLTYMRNGTPDEVEAAASMALQVTIGWPCDPIPGGDNQPCASRVVSAAVMAITFSDVALSGKNAVLPFHEAVDIADRIGRRMPPELRCTSKGGCCDAPAAIHLMTKFREWYAMDL